MFIKAQIFSRVPRYTRETEDNYKILVHAPIFGEFCLVGILFVPNVFLCTVTSQLFMAGLFGLHNPKPPTWNHDTWASDVK
jgi:hypothetical protein